MCRQYIGKFKQIECKASLQNATFHHAQLKGSVRVTVWFQVITESQINLAKVYSHDEMIMLKGHVVVSNLF